MGRVCYTNLPLHTEILLLLIIKQLPLLPQFVLRPGAWQVAGGQQRWLSVDGILEPLPRRFLAVRLPFRYGRNVSLLLSRFLFPQQGAGEVGGVLEPRTPFLLQYQRGQQLQSDFIPSAYGDQETQHKRLS